jgi:hypothetical protein
VNDRERREKLRARLRASVETVQNKKAARRRPFENLKWLEA